MATQANLHIFDDRVVWGSGPFTGDETARPACAILIGINGPLSLTLASGQSFCTPALLVGPNVRRTISVDSNAEFFSLSLDPTHRLTSWLIRERLREQRVVDISATLTPSAIRLVESHIHGQNDCATVSQLTDSLLTICFPDCVPGDLDLRVQKVATMLRQRLPARPNLEELAGRTGLSAGRLSHLFREQTGIPMRSYLLWLKMLRAAALFSRSMSMVEVASEIGFSDSSHLAHTFRDFFSVTPSWLADRNQVHVCDCQSRWDE